MSLHFHKKEILASSTTLKNLLKKYSPYEEAESAQGRHEQYGTLYEKMHSLSSCVLQLKAGIKSLQSEIDNTENYYLQIKSEVKQKQILLEMENLEKETNFYQLISDAEVLSFAMEEKLAIFKFYATKPNKTISLALQTRCTTPTPFRPEQSATHAKKERKDTGYAPEFIDCNAVNCIRDGSATIHNLTDSIEVKIAEKVTVEQVKTTLSESKIHAIDSAIDPSSQDYETTALAEPSFEPQVTRESNDIAILRAAPKTPQAKICHMGLRKRVRKHVFSSESVATVPKRCTVAIQHPLLIVKVVAKRFSTCSRQCDYLSAEMHLLPMTIPRRYHALILLSSRHFTPRLDDYMDRTINQCARTRRTERDYSSPTSVRKRMLFLLLYDCEICIFFLVSLLSSCFAAAECAGISGTSFTSIP